MTKIPYYFDEMMPREVAKRLTERGYMVIMAVDVEMGGKNDDKEHLPYASERGLILVTQDEPFAGRTLKRYDHAGLVCWTGIQNDFGGQIKALAQFADEHMPDDVKGRVFWLK